MSRVALITGAAGEIGRELAGRVKADVVFLGGRDEGKLVALGKELGTRYRPFPIDLASLASIEKAAARLKGETDRIDLFFGNAGVMATDRSTTRDGFETQIGVNHLGHFALTAHLMPIFATGAHVVMTSSSAAWMGKMNFDDLMSHRKYSRYGAYCQAKLANMLFAFELDRRCAARGIKLTANAAHPGFVYGHLQEAAIAKAGWFEKVFYQTVVKHLMAQPVAMGVEPLLMAAEGPGRTVFGPNGFIRGAGKQVKPPKAALDEASAAKLWELSEKLTGLTLLP